MMKLSHLLALVMILSGTGAAADDYGKELSLGAQIGATLPAGNDLRITAGSGPNLDIGIHATWHIDEFHSLRPRMELWSFNRGHQDAYTPQVQRIETKVQGVALGVEYLSHPGTRHERWSAGAGLYLIRWSIKSTNQLSFPEPGTAQASGTSNWTRPGLGLIGCYRLSSTLQLEARWIFSRYGYEDLRANLGTVCLLWNF